MTIKFARELILKHHNFSVVQIFFCFKLLRAFFTRIVIIIWKLSWRKTLIVLIKEQY